MRTEYVKRGCSGRYIAARLPLPWEPFPSWFAVLERAGLLRIGEDVEARVITGQWWRVNTGDWVVLQQGVGVWHIEHDDFVRMFMEKTNG